MSRERERERERAARLREDVKGKAWRRVGYGTAGPFASASVVLADSSRPVCLLSLMLLYLLYRQGVESDNVCMFFF